MNTTKIIYGIYADDDDLMAGVKAFRDKGIKINEVYTPFPVHLCSIWATYRWYHNLVYDEPRLATEYWG